MRSSYLRLATNQLTTSLIHHPQRPTGTNNMSKVSSHLIKVATPITDEIYGHSSTVHALSLNGFSDTGMQFIPRRFNVRTGKAYDIVERERDGALFAVRGTNRVGIIIVSRFNGNNRDLE